MIGKIGLLVLALTLAGCNARQETAKSKVPTAAEAGAFVATVEKTLAKKSVFAARTEWVNANFITYDTDAIVARVSADMTALQVKYAKQARKYDGLKLDPVLRRKLDMIKLQINLPAPSNAKDNEELAQINASLASLYSTGRDPEGRTLGQLTKIMATSRDPKQLLKAWTGWRTISPVMKAKYARMVAISNKGARELGYPDVGYMWRSNYDMPANDFRKETDRLWLQVKPLYDSLQFYVKTRLNAKYGDKVVPMDQPIPADLLGNMWAQSWENIYDLVAPKNSNIGYNLTDLLVKAHYDNKRMVKAGENFFTSLGFDPLPATFWQRSLFAKPRDREVVCHASAWDINNKDDIRIKMCINITGEDFRTIHHELGHNFYQRAYKNQDFLFENGANGGFHEAIGDTIALSITPKYLQQIGLLKKLPGTEGDLGLLMKRALDKVAFLPFGLMMDKWRWQVFDGELTPKTYNEGWWKLRRKYQGVRAPVARPADAFDPGAKYHIPNSVSYTRYFIADILQFQFYRAACKQAGFTGPLYRCSFYNNKTVGKKFKAMLELGASKPWPDALEAFTGTRKMDASAILEYFAPLKKWLDEQNKSYRLAHAKK
ncbi:MAG: M2 family metallopeptidase [Alphaproteobacteria bacterium]|nr:M2 family metallopeptidase [Alphaproteobacteria bacterium]